ncbi:MAG: hypothetical protein KKC99_13150 [Proteobacteria bacterium]|nr:hypothetical protein [Pseudomonadota bacterium]
MVARTRVVVDGVSFLVGDRHLGENAQYFFVDSSLFHLTSQEVEARGVRLTAGGRDPAGPGEEPGNLRVDLSKLVSPTAEEAARYAILMLTRR